MLISLTCQNRPDTITTMNGNPSTPDAESAGRPGRLFYGWWILIACSLLAIFGGAITQSQSLLVIPMRDEMDLTVRSTALIFALGVCLRKNVLNDNRLQQSLIFRFWPHWSLSIEKEISR